MTESHPIAVNDAPVATEIFDLEAGEEPVHEDPLQDAYELDWAGPLPTHGSTVVGDEVTEEAIRGEEFVENCGSTTGATEYYKMAETGEETAHGSTVAVSDPIRNHGRCHTSNIVARRL